MNGEFEMISHGGKVLKDTTAMTAEREALRMGVEQLMTLFPVETKDFQFVVESESRETKYKVDTQSCVSSAFAMIMRRTCIVPMRIVLEKKAWCSSVARASFPSQRIYPKNQGKRHTNVDSRSLPE